MRLLPIILAALVAAVLYAVVIERERLDALVGGAEADPGNETAPAEQGADATSEAIRVLAMHSAAQEIDSAVVLRGETAALREVTVMAETTGKVISEPLRKGAFVSAGDTLCELDPGTRAAGLEEARAALAEARASRPEAEARIPEAEARLAEAEAALQEAEINAAAASALSGQGYASETRVAATTSAMRSAEAAISSAKAGREAAKSGLQSLEARIRAAEAAVARAEDEIDRLTITAPFDGLLESDTAELGSLMQAGGQGGDPCATILQLDPIKLVGFVPEADIGRVKVGAPASARLTEGGTVAGEVTFVSRNADETTRTFRVEIRVANPDLAVSAGQTAEIAIESDGAMAHLVPQSALTLSDDGALGLRTVDEASTARFVPVEIIRDTPRGLWVAGLPEAVDVITLGQEYVIDGVPVRPTFEDILPAGDTGGSAGNVPGEAVAPTADIATSGDTRP